MDINQQLTGTEHATPCINLHTVVVGLLPHTLLTRMPRDRLMSARHDSTAALLENLPVLLMPTAQRRSRCCVRDYSKLVFITRPPSPCCIRSDQLRTLNNGAPSYAASTTSTAEYLSGLLLLHTGLTRAGYGVLPRFSLSCFLPRFAPFLLPRLFCVLLPPFLLPQLFCVLLPPFLLPRLFCVLLPPFLLPRLCSALLLPQSFFCDSSPTVVLRVR